MVLALVPYGLVKILAPVFYGIDRPRVPLIASAAAVAVNVAFNAMTFRQLGAPGLALGLGLGMAVNYLILRIGLRHFLGSIDVPRRVRDAIALVLAIVDRLEGGADAIRGAGLRFEALYDRNDFPR